MKLKYIFLITLVLILGSLTGCRIIGGYDDDSSTVSSAKSLSISGQVQLPSLIGSTSPALRSLRATALDANKLQAVLISSNGTQVAGPVPVDPASGTFQLTQVSPGENLRVDILYKGKSILRRHLDQVEDNKQDVAVSIETTTISILVEKSSFQLKGEQVEKAIIGGSVNIEAISTAINNWLQADTTSFDNDVMSQIQTTISEKLLLDLVTAVPASQTAVITQLPTGQDKAISPPSDIQVSIGDEFIELKWSKIQGAQSYNLYWGTSSNINTLTSTRIRGITSPYRFKPQSLGVPYYFVITSVSMSGESAKSSEVSGTGIKVTTTPSAPTIEITKEASGSVSIKWSPVAGATEYKLYYHTQTENIKTSGTSIQNATSPYTIQGLTNHTPYYIVLTAINSFGESVISNQCNATPITTPEKPGEIQLTAKEQAIQLSWSPVIGAKEYIVYWSNLPDVNPNIGTPVKVTSSSFLHQNLRSTETYYYIVTAVNGQGTSLASNQISGTPLSAQVAETQQNLEGDWNLNIYDPPSYQSGSAWSATLRIKKTNETSYEVYFVDNGNIDQYNQFTNVSVSGNSISFNRNVMRPEGSIKVLMYSEQWAGVVSGQNISGWNKDPNTNSQGTWVGYRK